MKKVFLSAVFAAMVILAANAQTTSTVSKNSKFSIGLNAGFPVGDAKSYSNLAIGGDLQGEYTVVPGVALTASAGYLNFSGKDNLGSSGFIPVLVGGKFHFTDRVYGHAQFGISFSTESGGGSAFTYVPSLGYDVSDNFDIAIKYQAATKNSFTVAFLGIRAAYSF